MSQPYLSLEAELHDAFWAADDDASEVRLMASFLKKFPGTSLEIGSGSGRLLFPLLSMGFDVEGLELSKDMLALCRKSGSCTAHEGDMTTWTPGKSYAALLAPAFTFQLAADPAATLSRWKTWLQPGGGLYLTVFIPFAELEGDLPEDEWYEDHQVTLPDGRLAKLDTRHRLNPENQLLERQHRYYFADRPDSSHESRQRLRWFQHDQMNELLNTAGFTLTSAFLDFELRRKATARSIPESGGIITYHAIASAGA